MNAMNTIDGEKAEPVAFRAPEPAATPAAAPAPVATAVPAAASSAPKRRRGKKAASP